MCKYSKEGNNVRYFSIYSIKVISLQKNTLRGSARLYCIDTDLLL